MGNMLYWYTFLKYTVLTELQLPGKNMVESHRHNIKQRNYIYEYILYHSTDKEFKKKQNYTVVIKVKVVVIFGGY